MQPGSSLLLLGLLCLNFVGIQTQVDKERRHLKASSLTELPFPEMDSLVVVMVKNLTSKASAYKMVKPSLGSGLALLKLSII
jgi:hypothetical protein